MAIYSAKTKYQSLHSAETYETRPMYQGLLGKLRKRIELRVIGEIIDELPNHITILDCPCGNGRWLELLARKASKIDAVDISDGMVSFATKRVNSAPLSIPVEVRIGDAEHLDFSSNELDYVFSYALLKHVPAPIQQQILQEFARVSANGVICSLAIFSRLSYIVWRFKNIKESYPLTRKELVALADNAGLRIVKMIKISQPLIGLEYMIQFEPVSL